MNKTINETGETIIAIARPALDYEVRKRLDYAVIVAVKQNTCNYVTDGVIVDGRDPKELKVKVMEGAPAGLADAVYEHCKTYTPEWIEKKLRAR